MPDIDNRFKVKISSSKTSGEVEAWLPENVEFDITSDWVTPLAGAGSVELLGVASAFHVSPIAQFMSVAIWTGSSPIVLTLPLQFVAENPGESAKIINDIKFLMKLALPGHIDKNLLGFTTTILTPPGPNPVGDITSNYTLDGGSESITVKIGNFIQFKDVIVLRVSPSFSSYLDHSGLPMRASVSLTFRSFNTPTKTNLDSILKSRVSNVGAR